LKGGSLNRPREEAGESPGAQIRRDEKDESRDALSAHSKTTVLAVLPSPVPTSPCARHKAMAQHSGMACRPDSSYVRVVDETWGERL
jgi:hypothetical protein